MDKLLNLDNPNLDGDFVAVRATYQEHKLKPKPKNAFDEEDETSTDVITDARSPDDVVGVKRKSQQDAAVPRGEAGDKVGPELRRLREQLVSAAEADSVDKLRTAVLEVQALGRTLADDQLRRESDRASVLHLALLAGSKDVGRHLLRTQGEALLMDDYDVVVRGVPSRKTCLHIMVEQDDVQMVRTLLETFTNDVHKKEFIHRQVLSEVAGQRPRHLSGLHIAALHGTTVLVELLVRAGVSVNSTNNKNDTPVLWAARGNHIGTTRRLIELGAHLHHENDKGSTPLYWAVRYGFTELVKVLVDEGRANIHQKRKLGLVSMVVLASALGFQEITEFLLEKGADVNTRITNNQVALHFAAMAGYDDVINVLANWPNADIDAADDSGDTALMFAAKCGYVRTMRMLINHGANVDHNNKLNQTIWDFALQSDDPAFLPGVVAIYRRRKRMRGNKLLFVDGKTPLHVAASMGDVDKLKCLCDLGADPASKDQNGNTFLHVAARDNQTDIIKAFVSTVDINVPNADGNTAIHLAGREGHIEVIQLLIKKSKLDVKNEMGGTPLHATVRSDTAPPEAVKLIVDSMVTANNWSLVDHQDGLGNSALHVAGFYGREDSIYELNALSPSKVNNDGDNALHVAAKKGHSSTLEMMLDVFSKPGKGLNLNQANADGETLLHICAKRGDDRLVMLLIAGGADLSLRNEEQMNSVLHELAEETMRAVDSQERLLAVYATIVNSAALWWCVRNRIPYPDEESDTYSDYQREAMLYLCSDVFNREGYDLVSYCTAIGSAAMLEAMLNTPNVYRTKVGKDFRFDVTDILPRTMRRNRRKTSKRKKMSRVSNISGKSTSDEVDDVQQVYKSSFEILVDDEDELRATQMLDMEPFRQLAQDLWGTYQWIYLVLIVVHIVYMSLFSHYSIDLLNVMYNNSATVEGAVRQDAFSPRVFPWLLFLSWPIVLLVVLLTKVVVMARRYFKHQLLLRQNRSVKDDESGADDASKSRAAGCGACCGGFNVMKVPSRVISGLFHNITAIAVLLFVASVVAWYALYLQSSRTQVYPACIVLIVGWLMTLQYLKGFQDVHSFSIMLTFIIVRDITRFLLFYILVLVAFACGMHVLFLMVPNMVATYPTLWDTVFIMFNVMLGMGDPFTDTFDQDYAAVGSNGLFAKLVYMVYVTMTTIILLNLLIAMMSDTYNHIRSREGTTWRVGSVRLGLRVEHYIPFLRRALIRLGCVSDNIVNEGDRWFLRVPCDALVERTAEVNDTERALQRLDKKIEQLATMNEEIDRKLVALDAAGGGGGGGGGRTSPMSPSPGGRPKSARRELRHKVSRLNAPH